MAHILVTNWLPQNKVKEMLNVYTSKDKPAYPDFLKKIHHWTTVSSEGLIKSYAVYECPDVKIIDGIINGSAFTVDLVGRILRLFQTGYVQTYVFFITVGLMIIAYYVIF